MVPLLTNNYKTMDGSIHYTVHWLCCTCTELGCDLMQGFLLSVVAFALLVITVCHCGLSRIQIPGSAAQEKPKIFATSEIEYSIFLVLTIILQTNRVKSMSISHDTATQLHYPLYQIYIIWVSSFLEVGKCKNIQSTVLCKFSVV